MTADPLGTPHLPVSYGAGKTHAAFEVCPHCLRPLSGWRFLSRDGVTIGGYHCPQHGDVVPRRSAVRNDYPDD